MVSPHTYKLTAYPKEITLRDGTRVIIKPMAQEDQDALLKFFLRIPAEDRNYFKEDVTSPDIIKRWAEELDYDRVLPLLTWFGDRIVADGTLHRTRIMARRHVGEIRIVVDPEFRERGLGTTLIHELAAVANENGLERLLFQAIEGKEDAAISAAEFVGFITAGTLRGHAKDSNGHPRDIVLMEMPLGKWFEWWEF